MHSTLLKCLWEFTDESFLEMYFTVLYLYGNSWKFCRNVFNNTKFIWEFIDKSIVEMYLTILIDMGIYKWKFCRNVFNITKYTLEFIKWKILDLFFYRSKSHELEQMRHSLNDPQKSTCSTCRYIINPSLPPPGATLTDRQFSIAASIYCDTWTDSVFRSGIKKNRYRFITTLISFLN